MLKGILILVYHMKLASMEPWPSWFPTYILNMYLSVISMDSVPSLVGIILSIILKRIMTSSKCINQKG